MTTWSQHFDRHIIRRGSTQQAVAFELKLAPSKISYWRRGTRPRDEEERKRIDKWSKGDVPWDAPERDGASAPRLAKAGPVPRRKASSAS